MVRYSYLTILGFCFAALLGGLVISRINYQGVDGASGNFVTIIYSWPNARAQTVERELTTPIEGVTSTLEGITSLESVSRYGGGQITISIDKSRDLDKFRLEIVSLIRHVHSQLPIGVPFPIVKTNTFTDPLKAGSLSYYLVGGDSDTLMANLAAKVVRPRLSRIDGVARVTVAGLVPQVLAIEYYEDILQSLRLSRKDIFEAINRRNAHTSIASVLLSPDRETGISISASSDKIANTIIRNVSGRIIRLKDVAKLTSERGVSDAIFRINGKDVIEFGIEFEKGADAFVVADETANVVKTLRYHLPVGCELKIAQDNISEIRALRNRGLIAGCATFFLILFFFGLWLRSIRLPILLGLSTILVFFCSILLVYICRLPVSTVSIQGLSFFIALVAGNLILTLKIYSNGDGGRIGRIMIGTFFLAIATLFALNFLPAEYQSNLKESVQIMAVFAFVSTGACLYLLPALLGKFAPNYRLGWSAEASGWNFNKTPCNILVVVRRKRIILPLIVLLWGLPVSLLPYKIENGGWAGSWYNAVLGSDEYIKYAKLPVERALGGTFRLFTNYLNSDFEDEQDDQSVLHVKLRLNGNSTIEQLDDVLTKIESLFQNTSEIERYVCTSQGTAVANVSVYFRKEGKNYSYPNSLKRSLIDLSMDMSGIKWEIYGVGKSFSNGSREDDTHKFKVSLRGYNYIELDSLLKRFSKRIISHPRVDSTDIIGVAGDHIYTQRANYQFEGNATLLGILGVSVADVFEQVRYSGVDRRYELILGEGVPLLASIRPIQDDRLSFYTLTHAKKLIRDSLYVSVNFSSPERSREPVIIKKVNQQYIRELTFEYLGSLSFGTEFLDKTVQSFKQELPLGYSIKIENSVHWLTGNRIQWSYFIWVGAFFLVIGIVLFESLWLSILMTVCCFYCTSGMFVSFNFAAQGFNFGGYTAFVVMPIFAFAPIFYTLYSFQMEPYKNRRSCEVYFYIMGKNATGLLGYIACICISACVVLFSLARSYFENYAVGIMGVSIGVFVSVFIIMPLLLTSFYRNSVDINSRIR